ncbi:hypothetical protein Tco_0904399 [Tanacetum coccineum]
MDDELRESYRTLKKRLFHEGRIVTPSFIAENNMLPYFQTIGLKPFLTLNEPICPRSIVEFYHSLEVKRDEELCPYIEFTLANAFFPQDASCKRNITIPRTTQTQLQRDPNKLHLDEICPELRGWELFFRENFFCSLGKRNKVNAFKKNKQDFPMPFAMLLNRLYRHILQTNPQAIVPPTRFTFHEHVMDPLDIFRNLSKKNGKKSASPSIISSSSSSSDDNEVQFFLEFYDELSDCGVLTKAQREK